MKQITCEKVDEKRIASAISDFLNKQKSVHTGKPIIPIPLSGLEKELGSKFHCALPFDRVKLKSLVDSAIESRNRYMRAVYGSGSTQFRFIESMDTAPQAKGVVHSVSTNLAQIKHIDKEPGSKGAQGLSNLVPVFANVVNLKYGVIKTINWPAHTLFVSDFLNDSSLAHLRRSISSSTSGPMKQIRMQPWKEPILPSIACLADIINKVLNDSKIKAVGWITLSPGQHIDLSQLEIKKNVIIVSVVGNALLNGSSSIGGKFQISLFQGSLTSLINSNEKMEIIADKGFSWTGLVFN
jgi:hypothetical protein